MPDSSVTAFRLAVDVRRLPSMRRLATDYAHDFAKLAEFFAGDPSKASDWRSVLERVQRLDRPRAAIADALVAQQQRNGAPEAALAAAGQLADSSTVAIVTGQQAGLFGGPLYTLLKAITAVKLAAHVQKEYGTPAVPVFWVEGEDHDWDEVASCTILDRDYQPNTLTLPAPPAAGAVPVAALPLDDSAQRAMSGLIEWLAPTEFTGPLVERLRDAYGRHRTMSDAFARCLLHVLGDYGLVVYDASDPATKPFVSHLFRQELEQPRVTSELASRAGEVLASRGYHAQVLPAPDATALFHLGDARTPIRVGADGRARDGTRSVADLMAELEARPWAFSPNVLLRPLVQDSLFPTAAYVAGPNELAYLGQLRDVYDRFGVPMPLMYPRATATLLDAAAARFVAQGHLPFEALARNDEAELNRLLEEQLPEPVEHAWIAARDGVEQRMQALVDALPQLDATLEGAARSALGRMRHDLETLHGKIIQAAKRRDDTLRRQFSRARALAFPNGEPQERVVGFVYFLNRYGPRLVDRLLSELPLDIGQHWVLTI
jgi:bacillithiol synthase